MPMRKPSLGMLALLIACGSTEQADQHQASEALAIEPARASPVAKAEVKQQDAKNKPNADMFGHVVGPFGPVAKLKLGMTEDKVKVLAPSFVDDKGKRRSVESDGLRYELVYEERAHPHSPEPDRLTAITIDSVNLHNLENLARQAWGAGTLATRLRGGNVVIWFAPATHTRAIADGAKLILDQYMPLRELLGPHEVAIAMFPKRILGRTLRDLKADYRKAFLDGFYELHQQEYRTMYFLPTEWGSGPLAVTPTFDLLGGEATGYRFTISDELDAAGKERTLAALRAKWGEPRVLESYNPDKPVLIFRKTHPLIAVSRAAQNDGWEIEIRVKDDGCSGPCFD
jgi:hypothetical protein